MLAMCLQCSMESNSSIALCPHMFYFHTRDLYGFIYLYYDQLRNGIWIAFLIRSYACCFQITGDVDGNSGSVIDVQKNDSTHTIYIKSRPLQWACDNVPCYCVFEKWIKLVGTAVVVDAKLTNARKDMTKYGDHGQELPAIYTIGSLYRTVAYNGTSPFTNASLTYYPLKEPVPILASEHWAALVNEDNWGLGVFQPGTIWINSRFFGTPGKYGPLDDPTGYLGPYHSEILDWNITYTYQFHLVLGTLDDIRVYAYQNQHLIENCLMADFRYNASRQHWYYVNANDSGVPNGHWHVSMEQNDPQLYGPNCLWKTADHPKLYINASFSEVQASTEAQVFWNPYGVGQHFDETHSMSFTIIPDGAYHVYEVDLSQSASYTGSGFGLRFDPVVSGTKGAYVDIAFIRLM